MSHDHEQEGNGYVKWSHLVTASLTVTIIIVTVGIALAGYFAGQTTDVRAQIQEVDKKANRNAKDMREVQTTLKDIQGDLKFIREKVSR